MGSVKLMDTKRIFPGADDFGRVAVTAITNKLVHAIMVHECLPI